MGINTFCRKLPKVELHAHLNGSLSNSTMLQLKRYLSDSGVADKTDIFFDEFQIGAGDTRSLTDCFQVFKVAHTLTSTPEALSMATKLTLQEFEQDGCCYIELRSTPKETPYMSRQQYIATMVQAMKDSSKTMKIISKLIISIDRRSTYKIAEDILNLALKYHKLYPDVVVALELSGDPTLGKFQDFVLLFNIARDAGLKVTLHCGEVYNPGEVLEMLKFKPDRIGHGICIHPKFGGTDETWETLCQFQIPVEVCLTSNVNTKSTPDYESHHFKELCEANVPVIICTDDKGVFATSLSQEYTICAEIFTLNEVALARLSSKSIKHIFADEETKKTIDDAISGFIRENKLILD